MYQVIIKGNDTITQMQINDIQELESILPKDYTEVEVKKVEDEKTK